MNARKKFLAVPLDDFSLEDIAKKVLGKQRIFQIFINIHKLVLFHKDSQLNSIIQAKDTVCSVDGKWVQFLAKMQGFSNLHRFGGLEVIEKFFSIAQKHSLGIYLLGAKKLVLDKAKHILSDKFPDAKIVGAMDGFFQQENEVVLDIKVKKPDILFLALPSPRKEILGYRLFKEIDSLVYVVGVGGAFDIIAGEFKRAPKILQDFGLEWVWRCLGNRKLFKRYFHDFFDLVKLLLYVR